MGLLYADYSPNIEPPNPSQSAAGIKQQLTHAVAVEGASQIPYPTPGLDRGGGGVQGVQGVQPPAPFTFQIVCRAFVSLCVRSAVELELELRATVWC